MYFVNGLDTQITILSCSVFQMFVLDSRALFLQLQTRGKRTQISFD